jgi:hypothetical protein
MVLATASPPKWVALTTGVEDDVLGEDGGERLIGWKANLPELANGVHTGISPGYLVLAGVVRNCASIAFLWLT